MKVQVRCQKLVVFNLMLCTIVFFTGCASKFSGTNVEAVQAREDAAAKLLDVFAPDGCSYNRYKVEFMCDSGINENLINENVISAKEGIIEYLYQNPYLSNKHELGYVIMQSIYGCNGQDGGQIMDDDMLIYCDTELSTYLTENAKNDGQEWTLTEVGGRYKYIFR